MRPGLKITLVICVMFQLPSIMWGADTMLINLTYKHKLDNAGRTKGYMTINQQLFTPDGVKFREVNYNESDGQIASYIFYFYENGRISTEECYNSKDSLLYILRHEYNPAGKLSALLRLEPDGKSLKQAGKTIFKYDASGRMTAKKIYAGKTSVSENTWKYAPNGNLLQETSKSKTDAVKSQKRVPVYGANGKMETAQVTGQLSSGKPFERTETYAYDDAGRVSTITIKGTDLPDGLIKTYRYFPSGSLSLYEESNAANLFSLVLQYDYKKHYMEKGTQISYFDKKK
jgi:YD repeat-containing protein